MSIFARQKAPEPLEDRLRKVEDLCADLKREGRTQELAYIELYDKVRHQMSRMAKRDAASRKLNDTDPEIPAPDLPFPDADPVSRSIMMRRARQGKI